MHEMEAEVEAARCAEGRNKLFAGKSIPEHGFDRVFFTIGRPRRCRQFNAKLNLGRTQRRLLSFNLCIVCIGMRILH